MTLKDLFLKHNNYIVEFVLNDLSYIYIEGLDKNGNNIQGNFDIKNIKKFCIEVFYENDYLETIDTYDIKLNSNINILIDRALNELKYVD